MAFNDPTDPGNPVDTPDEPPKLSLPDFATRIRAKAEGAYTDLSDADLVDKFVRKNPVYADAVDLPKEFSVLGGATSGYKNLDSIYEQAAREHNVPGDLLLEQGRQETINFHPSVMYGRLNSPKGARGAGQFMPGSAPQYGLTVNATQDDRTDPIKSINAQAKYMRHLLDKFGGDENLALAGYNAGEGRRSLANGQVPNIPETQKYVQTIGGKLQKARSQSPRLRDLLPTTTQAVVPDKQSALPPPTEPTVPQGTTLQTPHPVDAQGRPMMLPSDVQPDQPANLDLSPGGEYEQRLNTLLAQPPPDDKALQPQPQIPLQTLPVSGATPAQKAVVQGKAAVPQQPDTSGVSVSVNPQDFNVVNEQGQPTQPVVPQPIASQPREFGKPTDDLNRVAGEFTPAQAKDDKDAMAQALTAIGGQYGITPQQVQEYVHSPHVSLPGGYQAGDKIQVPFSTIAAIKGEAPTIADIRTEQAQARPGLVTPAEMHVGENWATQDAEWLNSNAGKALWVVNPLLATLPEDAKNEIASSLVGGAAGGASRTWEALAGIARPIDAATGTDFASQFREIASSGKILESKTGKDDLTSTIFKAVGGAPSDLSRMYLLSRLPTGAIAGMAVDQGIQSAGRGDPLSHVAVETGKGAVLGGIFAVAPFAGKGIGKLTESTIAREAATVTTILGGTTGFEMLTGAKPLQALHVGIVNSLFHLSSALGSSVVGKTIHGTDAEGNEATIRVNQDGTLEKVTDDAKANIQLYFDKDAQIQNEKLLDAVQTPEALEQQRVDALRFPKAKQSQADTDAEIRQSTAEVGKQDVLDRIDGLYKAGKLSDAEAGRLSKEADSGDLEAAAGAVKAIETAKPPEVVTPQPDVVGKDKVGTSVKEPEAPSLTDKETPEYVKWLKQMGQEDDPHFRAYWKEMYGTAQEAAPPPAQPAKDSLAAEGQAVSDYDRERQERIDTGDERRYIYQPQDIQERFTRDNPALRDNPQTVVLYRSTTGKSVNEGDFVYLNRKEAAKHQSELGEDGARIVSKEVPIGDLVMGQDTTEFIYSPAGKGKPTEQPAAISDLQPPPKAQDEAAAGKAEGIAKAIDAGETKVAPDQILKTAKEIVSQHENELSPQSPDVVSGATAENKSGESGARNKINEPQTTEPVSGDKEIRTAESRPAEAADVAERRANGAKPEDTTTELRTPAEEAQGVSGKVDREAAYKADVEELRNLFRKDPTMFGVGPALDPKAIKIIGRIANYHIENGVAKISELAKKAAEDLGVAVEKIRPHLEEMFPAMAKRETKPSEPTSTKNAVVEREREQRNLSPIEKAASRDFPTAWEDARKILERDPRGANDLVKEINQHPRSVSDTENALLLHQRIEARTRYDQAVKDVNEAYDEKDEGKRLDARLRLQRASDDLLQVDKASRSAGTEQGRGLNARRMMANEDFTLASLETQKRAAKGGRPLSDAARAHLQKVADDYKSKSEALEARLAEREQTIADMQAKVEKKRSAPLLARAEKLANRLRTEADQSREWLKQRGNVFTAGIDPHVMINLAKIGASHIADAGLDFAKWSDRMIEEFGEKIKPHLEDIYNAAKDILAKPGLSDESRLKAFKTRTTNRISDYEQRLQNKDFSKKIRTALVLDPEAIKLKAQVERVKKEFQDELRRDRLAHRSNLEKGLDAFSRWRRFGVLTWPTTLVKLTSAAAQRIAISPMEEVVGAGYSKLFPKIAEKAPREGYISIPAEASAIRSSLTTGMKDAYDTLFKKKGSDLDAQFDKNYPDGWLELPGRIHAALKAPAKRAEFERSMQKRIEQAIREGVDPYNELVQMDMMTGAFKDANRAIFMQDNRVTNAYNRFLNTLEAPNKEGKVSPSGKVTATAFRTILPIVKVPTNIVGETFQYAGGLLSGGYKLGKALKAGTENLSPEDADTILRHLKKGTIGPALMLLGYFNPQNVGGYYQQYEKRNKEDAQAAGMKLFGVQIPRILVHNPALEMLQIGATIRRVADAKFKKNDPDTKGIGQGVIEAATGLGKEVPFIEQFAEMDKLLSPNERQKYLGSLAKSITDPGLLQWIANQTDTNAQGEPIKRDPKTIVEYIKSGIPGLKQTLPEKIVKRTAQPRAPRFQALK